jgi:hypothetical protein
MRNAVKPASRRATREPGRDLYVPAPVVYEVNICWGVDMTGRLAGAWMRERVD